MVNWQVTATTVYCDAVDDDVTIIVYKDWSIRCTGCRKYVESLSKKTAKMLKRKAKRLGRNLRCDGPRDCRATEYRDTLIAQYRAGSI